MSLSLAFLALAPAILSLKPETEKLERVDVKAVGDAARKVGWPESHLLAVTVVESDNYAGAWVDGQLEPLIRFEGHIFYRQLAGAERDAAAAQGLAHAKAGRIKNPRLQRDRWALLARAAKINEAAAYESCSYGVGQVMGFHWKALGFASVHELVKMARSGQMGQVGLMCMFITYAKLDDELKAGAWAPFARGYNGPAYKTNAYDTKLAKAAALYGGADVKADGMLRMGAKGKRVRELQVLLGRAGFVVKPDGDFGKSTRDAVRDFQAAVGVTVDGIVGPETQKLLSLRRTDAKDDPGKLKALDIDAVKKGGLGAIASAVTVEQIVSAKGGLEAAVTQIASAGIQSALIDYVTSGLMVGAGVLGVAATVYGLVAWVKAQRTVEA